MVHDMCWGQQYFSREIQVATISATAPSTMYILETDTVDFFFNNSIPLTLLGHVTKGELRMDDTSFGYISDFIN